MKKILALLLSSWCGCALAQTAQELIDNGKNSENVTTFGMGYLLNQYSPLSQINKSNIKRLVPIWSTSLSNEALAGARSELQSRCISCAHTRSLCADSQAQSEQFYCFFAAGSSLQWQKSRQFLLTPRRQHASYCCAEIAGEDILSPRLELHVPPPQPRRNSLW